MSIAIAYCDGSYSKAKNKYGCGGVLVNTGYEFSFSGSSPSLLPMWNVGGEIAAATFIIDYAISKGYKELHLHYDYAGIEKWCTGEWKATKPGTKQYKNFYDSIKDKILVKFTHVKAHTNNKYNDLADTLAKKSLEIYS